MLNVTSSCAPPSTYYDITETEDGMFYLPAEIVPKCTNFSCKFPKLFTGNSHDLHTQEKLRHHLTLPHFEPSARHFKK